MPPRLVRAFFPLDKHVFRPQNQGQGIEEALRLDQDRYLIVTEGMYRSGGGVWRGADGGEPECEGFVLVSAGRVWIEKLPGMHHGLQSSCRHRSAEQGRVNLAQADPGGSEGGRKDIQRVLRHLVQSLEQGCHPGAQQGEGA